MSCAARSTFFGFFMWLPEPSSSPAPHFEGQRALSGGRFHCAKAMAGAMDSTAATVMRLMVFSLSVENLVQALVAELALVRRRGVRVEDVARAPHLEHGEVIGSVGLLHDLEAHVAGRRAV